MAFIYYNVDGDEYLCNDDDNDNNDNNDDDNDNNDGGNE